MKVLVADDNPQIRRMLESLLTKLRYDVVMANDGNEAWELLRQQNSLPLAILDRMMPGMDGITLCRKVREHLKDRPAYLLLLTALGSEEDIIEGFRAGADDYIAKPFSIGELEVRLQAGVRIVHLQLSLERQVKRLEEALAYVKCLERLLPICSYCKRILDDQKEWHPVELYFSDCLKMDFTHTICPECQENIVRPEMEQTKRRKKS